MIKKCINCKSNNFEIFFNLGMQPLSCKFPNKKERNPKQYELKLIQCKKCNLVQIKKIVNPKEMYGTEYGYYSSISPMMKNHLKEIFQEASKFTQKGDSILDIGSNDGTLLNFFDHKKFSKIVGVDPNIKIYSGSYKNHIEKHSRLFDISLLKDNILKKNQFHIIFAIAMFYDISKLENFLSTIKNILHKRGVWIVEVSYLKTLIQNMTYDQICHEHIAYYNLDTFSKILKKYKLKIVNCYENEINGGSIRVHIVHQNYKKYKHTIDLKEKILREKEFFKNDIKIFKSRVMASKTLINDYLNIISKNYVIYGYGASTKGNIILNYVNLNNRIIKKICDANSSKHGRVTPGSRIDIISKEEMRKEKPDYLFILIWSFRNEVIKQELNYIKKGGKLIIPYPSLHVIDKENYKFYIKRNINDFSFSN